MTIKELKATLEQRIEEEKIMENEAVCPFGEGLHFGTSLGLQQALVYISYLEVPHEASSN